MRMERQHQIYMVSLQFTVFFADLLRYKDLILTPPNIYIIAIGFCAIGVAKLCSQSARHSHNIDRSYEILYFVMLFVI
jgi:hypothetical protein